MIDFLAILFLAAVAWGCGWFIRGIAEEDRRAAKRLAKWERKWLK